MSCKKESSFVCRANMEVEDEKPKPTLLHHHAKPALHRSPTKPPQQQPPPPPLSRTPSADDLTDVEDIKKEQIPFQVYEENDIGNVKEDDDYLDSFPPGYRFCPLDEELVLHYLKRKVMNEPLPHNRIIEVNLYRYNPEKLAEQYKQYGEKEWYFFTPRDKKYRNGTRPNRAAGDGYWKATGADKKIYSNGVTVGFRKALVFYKGKPPKGDKTNWIMHEYRVDGPKKVYNDMRLDDWVLCRIYKKVDKSANRMRAKEDCLSPLGQHENANELINMDYEGAVDSMDYSNVIDNGFMHQSDVSYLHPGSDHHQFSTLALSYETHSKMVDVNPFKSLSMKYANDKGGGGGPDDIWSVANLDFASQLDFYGVSYAEPFINLENILPVETLDKDMKDHQDESLSSM